MATRTIVETIDDIDGGPADETVMFALDGSAYRLDLNKKNAAAFRKSFEKWVASAAKVKGGTRVQAGTSRPSARRDRANDNSAEVRAWANANGHKVPERGRIPAAIREAFDAARKLS